jgi:hypothetical protein
MNHGHTLLNLQKPLTIFLEEQLSCSLLMQLIIFGVFGLRN